MNFGVQDLNRITLSDQFCSHHDTTAGADMEKVTQKLEQGSPEVLEELGRAIRKIHGTGDPDLEQEVFLRTLKAFRRVNRVEHPRALIWKIAKDTVADHWRVRARDRWNDLDELQEPPAQETDIEGDLDRRRRVEQLRNAILKLGCDIRGSVYLFYMEDYSVASIARIYRKSPSAVKMALHRGRRKLERMFGLLATNKSRFGRL